MGNGVMPNGLSYRAHPRLYRMRRVGQHRGGPLVGVELKCQSHARTETIEPKLPFSLSASLNGSEGWIRDVPDLPNFDAHASKAVIDCLKPRHPTLCLFQHSRW